MTPRPSALLALLLCGVSAGPLRAENWPGWRGPTGQGVSGEKGLPVEWTTAGVTWAVPLEGAGVSTPVVWGDRVFLTASDGRRNDRLHVECFRRADGRRLWHTKLFGTAPTNQYDPGGMAVPTPVTDGTRLFALFGTGDLVCLDLDGRPVWMRSLAREYGEFLNRWGMGSSPLLTDGLLVVQVDHWGQSYLLAVDPATGRNRWKADRDVHVNWTSPVAVPVGGRTQLVALGTEKAQGYDAASGRLLWTAGGFYEQCVASPVLCDDLVLVGSSVGSVALRPAEQSRPGGGAKPVWENRRVKLNVPSPLCYEGLLYVPGDQGVVTCLDARTGELVWKERVGSPFHASPVGGDGKVYFAGKDGVVHVVRAGREFEFLARNDMGEMLVASPAVSGGQIFLRGERHLFCIGPLRGK